MKQPACRYLPGCILRRSYIGAWIETKRRRGCFIRVQGRSYIGAWIETISPFNRSPLRARRSYIGAWIETANSPCVVGAVYSRSYMGAWIETYRMVEEGGQIMSLLIWERGLKQRLLTLPLVF